MCAEPGDRGHPGGGEVGHEPGEPSRGQQRTGPALRAAPPPGQPTRDHGPAGQQVRDPVARVRPPIQAQLRRDAHDRGNRPQQQPRPPPGRLSRPARPATHPTTPASPETRKPARRQGAGRRRPRRGWRSAPPAVARGAAKRSATAKPSTSGSCTSSSTTSGRSRRARQPPPRPQHRPPPRTPPPPAVPAPTPGSRHGHRRSAQSGAHANRPRRHSRPHCGQHEPLSRDFRAGTNPKLGPALIRARSAALSVSRRSIHWQRRTRYAQAGCSRTTRSSRSAGNADRRTSRGGGSRHNRPDHVRPAAPGRWCRRLHHQPGRIEHASSTARLPGGGLWDPDLVSGPEPVADLARPPLRRVREPAPVPAGDSWPGWIQLQPLEPPNAPFDTGCFEAGIRTAAGSSAATAKARRASSASGPPTAATRYG